MLTVSENERLKSRNNNGNSLHCHGVRLSEETKPVSYQIINLCDGQGCWCYAKYVHLDHVSK